jgi:uncharacterized protein with beta-barrel porin domain
MRVSNVRASSVSLSDAKASRTDLAGRHVVALGLAIVSLTASERAAADCTPLAPISNTMVTCTGTTLNQNKNPHGVDGYGGEFDTGNTITVQSGASVTGDRAGLVFSDGTVKNFGTISGHLGIFGITVTLSNSGKILVGPGGSGILGSAATVDNSGTISAGAGSTGISTAFTATVTNSGTISAGGTAITTGTADVTNLSTGTISAGAGSAGILASDTATVRNFGTISAGTNGAGVAATTANVTNFGAISAGEDGILADSAIVRNSGTISAGTNGFGINATTVADVTNFSSGKISAGAGGIGIFAGSGTIGNFGTISAGAGGIGIFAAGDMTLGNSGTISAAGPGSAGISAFGTLTATNFGTISGGTGIISRGPSTIANAGTIIGLDGTAISLSGGADRLTLLPGSRVIGAIDMGGGNDAVNFTSTRGIGQLITLQNFTGTINTSGPGLVFHSATQIATLDPTALALADRSLLDFTGGISALVQGRLAGADVNGRPSTGAVAVGYTPDDRRVIGKAPPAPYAAPYAAPYVVWTEGFGGTRTQKATDELLRATSTAWGGVIGVDRQVRGDLLLGAFVGGGNSRLSVEQSAQHVDTDHVVGGVYGRFDWVSQFFDFKLQAGGSNNTSTRQVFSNLAPNGVETANGRYGGWFISPELGYGLRYGLGDGYTLTPMARVRYVAGVLDGYSESGLEPGLSFGRRTLQNLEERSEIELARTSQFGLTDTVRTYMHGGVIALQRVGDTTFNTALTGQSFTFATPGKDSATGAVAGAGFDLTVGGRVSVFGALEGTVMSDKSRTGIAKAGMRVAF